MQRRDTLKKIGLGAAVSLAAPSLWSCNRPTQTATVDTTESTKLLRLSLAQWSLHRAFQSGELNPNDFAKITKSDFGLEAVEYVNGFYREKGSDTSFWKEMLQKSQDQGVKNLLIMVDEEGDLGNPNQAESQKAVENHFKWVDAAKILGCHSIRVNAFGDGAKEDVQKAIVQSLGKLCSYAASSDIQVLIENHGLYSSDPFWIKSIIEELKAPNLGTLPDFGNWCLSAKWGSTQADDCTEVFDRYEGVKTLLPFAKGVSAKSYSFDEKGEQPKIDYRKMLGIVKESGFDAYIDIEYEGLQQSEPEGIRLTKQLIERIWEEL